MVKRPFFLFLRCHLLSKGWAAGGPSIARGGRGKAAAVLRENVKGGRPGQQELNCDREKREQSGCILVAEQTELALYWMAEGKESSLTLNPS